MPEEAAYGLGEARAQARLRDDGYNELPSTDHRGFGRILREVLGEPMFALLLAAGLVYLVLGSLSEALLLLAFATASVAITVIQETRSERVLESLRDVASPRALVIRDGVRRRIPGREVVRGDALVLVEGDRVPADAVLVEARDVLVDESLLTGESLPVAKAARPSAAGAAMERPGGEGTPFVFAGTLVVGGEGLGIVAQTGAASELGRIGQALRGIETEQPRLRTETRRLVRVFAIAGGVATLLVFLLYGLLHGDWLRAVLAGIALGMSMLPEEFPLVLSAFMVMGAWRLSRARVLTRRAAAIETLGSATVLCTDKTGTLTENRMRVVALQAGAERWREGLVRTAAQQALVEAARLASAAVPSDPMERAIAALASDGPAGWSLVRRYGLSPALPMMTNAWSTGEAGDVRAFAKGAPEVVARLCDGEPVPRAILDEMAGSGLRVLGVAEAACAPADLPASQEGFAFRWLGLVAFADPLRASVPAALAECRSAGVRVVMITGDYPATAAAVAVEAGLAPVTTIEGRALAALDDRALADRIGGLTVFARILPEQKLRIVEALKARGDVVAMTGDGVNDAPALKAAHIGIAMGGRGTDVAREAASIVLLDDDFASIVRTLALGRRIYDNLRKACAYIAAVHVPIAGLALLPLLFGLPLLLLPVHIAFLEMVIDPACSIVFEAEEGEADLMQRPPRNADSRLLSPALAGWGVMQGVLTLAGLAAVLARGVAADMPEDELRALAFVSLVLINVSLILVNRSFSASLLTALRRPNQFLWILVSGVAAVLGLALTWPPAMALFRFGALHADDLAVAGAAGLGVLVALELLKPLWRGSFRA